MAFPTTGVLDSFNAGASQNLTARSGWSSSVINTTNPDPSNATDSGPTFATSTSGLARGTNFWPLGAANAEAWATCATGGGGQSGFGVWARIQSGGTNSPSGYLAEYTSVTNQLDLFKVISGTPTLIASGSFFVVADGDSFGIECIGTTITAYLKLAAGSWGVSCTVTDSSITGAGDIGLSIMDNAQPVDLFSGGAIIAPAPGRRPVVRRLVGAGA